MFELLESVRKKPENTKRLIAFFISFLFCALMFVIWISVWYPQWKDGELAKQTDTPSTLAPLSSLTQTFSSGFSQVGNEFSKLKTIIKN